MPKPKYLMRPGVGELLERAGIVQAELARRVEMTPVALNRKLNGKQRGTLGSTAWKIAQVFAEKAHLPLEEAFDRLFERAQATEEAAQQEAV